MIPSIKGTATERLSGFTFFYRWFQIPAYGLHSASLKYKRHWCWIKVREYGWERRVCISDTR